MIVDDNYDAIMKDLGLMTALCGDYEACVVGAIYPFSSYAGMKLTNSGPSV